MDAEIVKIVNSLWYESLVDDCKAIITEAVFNSRWELIVGYHMLGKRIITDENYQRYAGGNGKILSDLSESTNISERDLYRSMQFYKKFPDLNKLPDGKNISWSKITSELLPDPEAKSHPGKTVETCFKDFENAIRYVQKNYPDWLDAMRQLFFDVLDGK